MLRLLALGLAVVVLSFPAAPSGAAEQVDLELVLLTDASRSIDDGEIRFQRQGYAAALTDPAVLSAILGGFNGRVALTFVEWGSVDSQEVVVPWTIIDGPDSAAAFAARLMAEPRRAYGPNAIGNALSFAHGLIAGNDIDGFRKVIDFSGDSAYSFGGTPIELARSAALIAGITINGLAILCRDCNGRPMAGLEQAFAEKIIGGPGSFVITADDRASFAEAVRRKLLLEIAGVGAPRIAIAE